MLRCLISYLQFRIVCVKIDSESSEIRNIDLDVPQGSVLRRLIFVLFMNDLPAHLTKRHCTIFADDTSVAVEADSHTELEETYLQPNLN